MTAATAHFLNSRRSGSARVSTVYLAGRLEAVANEGAADAPFAALVCPPHPRSFLADVRLPKLFLSGKKDAYSSLAERETYAAPAAEPRRFILITGADHFLNGQLEPMQQALSGWLKEQVA